jgi:DNA polymerase V
MSKIIALIDCNNFYVSCERVFNPNLNHRPVIVLSNNDGCCVSRSNEAKKIGIPMGAPHFALKDLIKQHNVKVFSSNYELYGDMSKRVLEVIKTFTDNIELYSIDEVFIGFDTDIHQALELAEKIRTKILKWTGIPTSIGMAKTKTIAKVASEYAKKKTQSNLFSLFEQPDIIFDAALNWLEVGEVWGVGRQLTKKLEKIGINNAYQLAQLNEQTAKKIGSVTLMRTVAELNQIKCLDLEKVAKMKKMIASTRSFGERVYSINELEAAIVNHIIRACQKLREEQAVAKTMSLFARTSYFGKINYYGAKQEITLGAASNYPADFISRAVPLVQKIFKKNTPFYKAGVCMKNICPQNCLQQPLYENKYLASFDKKQKIIQAVDLLNQKFGNNTVNFSQHYSKKIWQMKRQLLSACYTTKYADFLKVSL